MTYTPGEIRAAEEMCLSSTPSTSVQFAVNAIELAHKVLEHRGDYDDQGVPLLVDRRWLEKNCPHHPTLWIWEKRGMFGHLRIEYGSETVSAFWNGDYFDPCKLPRPQLRALIEVLS